MNVSPNVIDAHINTLLNFGHRIGSLKQQINNLKDFIECNTRYESMSEEMQELEALESELSRAKQALAKYTGERYAHQA